MKTNNEAVSQVLDNESINPEMRLKYLQLTLRINRIKQIRKDETRLVDLIESLEYQKSLILAGQIF